MKEEYRKKLQGCWMGKNIGGTLGAPFEFLRQVNDVEFYTQELGGEPLPNDDLDIQLLWLMALERFGPTLDAHQLAEYWCTYVTPHWSEYGIAKLNMRAGLAPPLSGMRGNDFKHSCGAFIRSEIWACIVPGQPDLAVRYAVQDAMLDHGDGEGTWAEIFCAALESAAFVCNDLQRLIEVGLSYIPQTCAVAQAVRLAQKCHADGMPWRDSRDEILRQHRGATCFRHASRCSREDHEKGLFDGELGFDVPSNIAITILGLLEGGDDFERMICTTVNCGEDTDCTGATAGALFGIMHGMDAIPEKWIDPIGHGIKTLCLNLGDLPAGPCSRGVPATIDEMAERTESVARRVMAYHGCPFLLEPLDAGKLHADRSREALARTMSGPTYRNDFISVTVEYVGGPDIHAGEEKTLRLHVSNCEGNLPKELDVSCYFDAGVEVEPTPRFSLQLIQSLFDGTRDVDLCLRATELSGSRLTGTVVFRATGSPMTLSVPILLLRSS